MPGAIRRSNILWSVATIGIVAALACWWLLRHRFEETDNAYVEAEILAVTPQVAGFIAHITVQQNQQVVAGQEIGSIQPADASLQLRSAKAKLMDAEAALQQLRRTAEERNAALMERIAAIDGARSDLLRATGDSDRFSDLAEKGWVTRRALQSSEADRERAKASLAQAMAAAQVGRAQSASLEDERSRLLAQLEVARVDVERFALDLHRTILRAPITGFIGPIAARIGQFVKPGDRLLTVVPGSNRYVVANFKETQVARIRIGQPVTIHADAFHGARILGKVQSFSPATGSEFAALPIENANGNFVKIVQRVPVRIVITDSIKWGLALRPGLSVSVSVDVRPVTGPNYLESSMTEGGRPSKLHSR